MMHQYVYIALTNCFYYQEKIRQKQQVKTTYKSKSRKLAVLEQSFLLASWELHYLYENLTDNLVIYKYKLL